MWLPVKTWDGSQSEPGHPRTQREDSNSLPTPYELCSLLLEGLQDPAAAERLAAIGLRLPLACSLFGSVLLTRVPDPSQPPRQIGSYQSEVPSYHFQESSSLGP